MLGMFVQDFETVYEYVSNTVKDKCAIEHAYNVAMLQMASRYSCVALLHDVVEDGYATIDELRKSLNLDDEQVAALDAITRRQGERYFDYIKRCKQNEMAKTIKLADLQDNINRCLKDLPNRYSLIGRYAKAYGILIRGGKCSIKLKNLQTEITGWIPMEICGACSGIPRKTQKNLAKH